MPKSKNLSLIKFSADNQNIIYADKNGKTIPSSLFCLMLISLLINSLTKHIRSSRQPCKIFLQAFNDENCPPSEEWMDSAKAGASVFGSAIFGSELPDHSLCYSPSPLVNRHVNVVNNNNSSGQENVDGKVLSFDKASDKTPKKRKEMTCLTTIITK